MMASVQQRVQHRNAAALLVYEFTCQSATMQMSPEEHQLIAALQGNQRDTDRFCGVLAQTVSVPEFFAPENIDRILAASGAQELAPA